MTTVISLERRLVALSSLCLLFALAALSMPATASAQSFVNPYRPIPQMRYPICDSLQTRQGGQNCTANPNLAHSRAECGDNCPEDVRDVYGLVGQGTLRLFCGDAEGAGCLNAFFTREHEPRFRQCIYRVVADDAQVHPDEQRFVIRVSQLRHQGRIDLVETTDGSHPRFARRYGRQMQDAARNNQPPPPGHYRRYLDPCRH